MKNNNAKDYDSKREKEVTFLAAAPRPQGKSTVDAMLDKISELIRQRTAWANLAQLLLIRGKYDSSDPEIKAAFLECYPTLDPNPSTLDPK